MILYLIKRILLMLPTLVVLSLVAFGLSKLTPGDPLDSVDAASQASGLSPLLGQERDMLEKAKFLGLDKPNFYVAFSAAAYPDTLHKILRKQERATAQKLIGQYGNWPFISAYLAQLDRIEKKAYRIGDTLSSPKLNTVKGGIKSLKITYKDVAITSRLGKVGKAIQDDTLITHLLQPDFIELNAAYEQVKDNPDYVSLNTPDLKWYGWDNQYHNWFSKFIVGDFGESFYDYRPVADKMLDAVFWTLMINGIAILLAYLISIPIGVYTGLYKDSYFDKGMNIFLLILYSLPSFWIATILVVFFSTPEYGMDFFPSQGLGNIPDNASFLERIYERSAHLILPIFCMTYGSLAFISRQMRGGMLNVINQDYIRTAYAKGLNKKQVVWRHAFRNALFPIITLFASLFPYVLAGSVVIEFIFNIPGMGKLTIESIYRRDWPVVYTVLMLSGVLTMIGIFVADLLYAWADPRVSFKRK